MDQYIAVAAGAWAGMMWPYVIRVVKNPPDTAVRSIAPATIVLGSDNKTKWAVWIFFTLIVAAVLAALNVVPLVVGDQADNLKKLGGWQYFFLATEGFALAAFVNEGIRPKQV